MQISQLLLFSILVVLSDMPRANAEEIPLEPVNASISLSESGRVEDVQCTGYIVQELCSAIMAAARRWEFTPATRRGIPVKSIIEVKLKLTGIADGESSLIRIDSVQDFWLPMNVPVKIVKPRYPREPLHFKSGAKVSIRAEIGANGVPVSTEVTSIIVSGTSKRFEKTFKASALQAARQWRYKPYRLDDVDKDFLQVTCIPVMFTPFGKTIADFEKELQQKMKDEQWTHQQTVNPCGLLLPGSYVRAKLKTNLIGTIL